MCDIKRESKHEKMSDNLQAAETPLRLTLVGSGVPAETNGGLMEFDEEGKTLRSVSWSGRIFLRIDQQNRSVREFQFICFTADRETSAFLALATHAGANAGRVG